MHSKELPLPAQLMMFIVGKWISKPIYAAAELGIADMLTEGPKTITELAQASHTHAPSLYRMMRALSCVGIFAEISDQRFELTPIAEYLKTGVMRSIALMFNSDWNDRAWGYFLDSIKTGDTAFETAHGMPVADWLEKNPRAAAVFNEANAIKAAGSHHIITDSNVFSGIDSLTDIGGGLGALMAKILEANPAMQGIVADLPSVIEKAREFIRDRGMEDRCQAVECDFFENIPPGSDAYLLSNILHDWSDERCRRILANCHMAMQARAKLLIIEMVVPPGNEPSMAKLLDLEMFVITGGRERTAVEFKDLLESSGFKLSRIIPTEENICIIEGIKV